jgi:hypothetical protein
MTTDRDGRSAVGLLIGASILGAGQRCPSGLQTKRAS